MKQALPQSLPTLGADLRALRRARGLTLAGLAAGLGRSVGWLSQVERDLSTPGATDLRQLAALLDVSLSSLSRDAAAPAQEAGHIVRRTARRPIGSRQAGLVEGLLSPDLTDAFEVVHSTFEPGAALTQPVTRPTQEVAYLVSGRLDLTIAGQRHTLGPGDSFRIRGEPFQWANPYPDPCIAIWIIAPPIY